MRGGACIFNVLKVTFWRTILSYELVHADIVNEELGGKLGLGIRRTGPVPSDGKVKEEMEALVERCRELAALG